MSLSAIFMYMHFMLLSYFLIGCNPSSLKEQDMKSKTDITCFIYPIGSPGEGYSLHFYGEYLFAHKGVILNSENKGSFRIQGSDSVRVDESIRNEIVQSVEQIQKKSGIDVGEVRKGGWIVEIMVNRISYRFYYGDKENREFDSLLNKLFSISPIKITVNSKS